MASNKGSPSMPTPSDSSKMVVPKLISEYASIGSIKQVSIAYVHSKSVNNHKVSRMLLGELIFSSVCGTTYDKNYYLLNLMASDISIA